MAGCFHCGLPCKGAAFRQGEKNFCCAGCLTVFELLTANGLGDFYKLGEAAGIRVHPSAKEDQFAFLDVSTVRERMVDFTDARLTRVTFRIPSIHCLACVWLLENLHRLNPGMGGSQVNFPRKEVAISFDPAQVKLSEVAALLASLGYEPELKFSDLQEKRGTVSGRRLWLQLGVAGFAFGNIMLFNLSTYLGLDSFSGPTFSRLTGWLSVALALPVFFYSASDYWRSAWRSLRQRMLTIDVPIAAGIVALFGQSIYEVSSGRGEGYFDSLAGLLFFLLCGKLFQQKTYDRLAFDRDYQSFFPLAVTRVRKGVLESWSAGELQRRDHTDHHSNTPSLHHSSAEERVSLSQLSIGDHLVIRSSELIPADARLVEGPAVIDYSFVTGESEPVEKSPGDHLYAGGRQIGGCIEIELVKAVSQSYLTSLWNQDAFRKAKGSSLDTITNRFSPRFTWIILAIATGAAVFWAFVEPARAVKSFTSVLIVACPCALALAAPFTLGTAQRMLGRQNVFLKNAHVTEVLARVNAVVFDKTGTLTTTGGALTFQGPPLSGAEETFVHALARHSTHPYAARISAALAGEHSPATVESFCEQPGCGMEGRVRGHCIMMGSAAWLEARGSKVGQASSLSSSAVGRGEDRGSVVHVAIDGRHRGTYVLTSALRPDTAHLVAGLSPDYELALLSGDNEKDRWSFAKLFDEKTNLHFNQSPLNKLEFIRKLQERGQTVMMVGDGLNDAGALQQSDVGVAVVENISAFSPASDVIMAAERVPRLPEVLRFSKRAMRVVRLSFMISTLYNVAGLSIAASGNLSPIVCAILMPLSSVTVMAFASGVTTWLGGRMTNGQ